MIRKLIAILFILIGLVATAAGIWGIYTVKTNSDMDMAMAVLGLADIAPRLENGDGNLLMNGVGKVLGAAGDTMNAVDQFFTEHFGRSLTDSANDLLGDDIDLTNELDVKLNICRYRTEILLIGIIIMQTGLLIWTRSRR